MLLLTRERFEATWPQMVSMFTSFKAGTSNSFESNKLREKRSDNSKNPISMSTQALIHTIRNGSIKSQESTDISQTLFPDLRKEKSSVISQIISDFSLMETNDIWYGSSIKKKQTFLLFNALSVTFIGMWQPEVQAFVSRTSGSGDNNSLESCDSYLMKS